MRGIVDHIGIVGIDGELLFAAGYENAGTCDNQRPERAQFVFCQRADFMKGLDRRKYEERVAIGVMQQGSAGDGEVGNQPARNQVAEINHSIGDIAAMALRAAHDVVIGDVVMDRLRSQARCKGPDALDGSNHRLGDTVPSRVVRHCGEELQGNSAGPAQIPLQFTFQPRMREIPQADGNTTGKPAEGGKSGFGEIFAPGQRLAFEKGEQTHLTSFAVHDQR